MKKVIAIAALLGLAGAAQAQVTVYGLVDAGYSKVDNAEGKISYSNNSTTRVGLKGETDLGSGYKGSFNLEAGGIEGDKGGKAFFDRQAWVGLSSGFGEIRFGTQDSAAFKALIGFDANGAANDTMAAQSAVVPVLGQNSLAGKELVNYISPSMGGLQVTVGVTPKGDRNLVADPQAKTNASFTLTYAGGPVAAAAVVESANSDAAGASSYSAFAASYDLGVVKLAAVVANGGTNAKGYNLAVSAPLAGATVGVQYANNTDTKNTGTEFFVNKEVLKNTTAYFEYGTQNIDKGAKTNMYSVGLIYVF